MIIPRHKICDVCNLDLTRNVPYVTLKKSALWAGSGGSFKECKKVHICTTCWDKVTREIAWKIDYKGRPEE